MNNAENAAASIFRSQASLLGIPQELRDKIFEYLYGVSDAANDRINIRLPRVHWSNVKSIKAEAMIACYQAPPSKDAILVCRQLYEEMSNMQAAAFRRYWEENTFHICEDDVVLGNRFYAGSDRDMQHAKHFVFHVRCDGEPVEVEMHFRAGKWMPSYYISDRLWSTSVYFQRFGTPAPQGPQPAYEFEGDMRQRSAAGAFSGERETMNPECGLGFTAIDLCVAKSTIDDVIVEWIFL